MKKQIACLLVLSALYLSSCGHGDSGTSTTSTAPDADTTTSTAVDTTEPIKTASTLALISEGKSNFKLVRAEEASSAIVSDVTALNKNIKKFTSVNMSIGTDWVPWNQEINHSMPEILIGMTNRQASLDLFADLPPHSYGIRVTENQVVIMGTNENMTAHALYAFESQFLLNQEYTGNGYLNLPIGTEIIYTSESLDSWSGILRSAYSVAAYVNNNRALNGRNSFNATQGAATDGTYFYQILMKNDNGVETGIIVKSKVEDFSEVLVSQVLPLDHANDMTYDSKRNLLVVTNMKGKTITRIDPETLTIVSTAEASISGTPWAIAYNAKRDCYVIAIGGLLTITDENFHVKSSFSAVSSSKPQVGQGMDADDHFIYMPLSPNPDAGTQYNVVMIYDWDGKFVREVPLQVTIESETILHDQDNYYMNFNVSGGGRISDLGFAVIYS